MPNNPKHRISNTCMSIWLFNINISAMIIEVVIVGDGDGSAGNGKEEGGDDANIESIKVSGEMITYIIIIGVEYLIVVVSIVISRKHSNHNHDHDGGSVHQAMADGNYGGVTLNSSNIGIDVVGNYIVAEEIERRRKEYQVFALQFSTYNCACI